MKGNGMASDAIADVKLVRDGELLEEYRSKLPAVIQRHDVLDAGRHYYRIMVQYDGSQILSNPIFCEVFTQLTARRLGVGSGRLSARHSRIFS